MQSETLKQKLSELDKLLEEAKKAKAGDDKLLASGREELRRLETQLESLRNEAEEAKTLMGQKKQSLGLRLIQEGDAAFKEAMAEIEQMEIKQTAAESAISQLETERDAILQQVADLRLKVEIPEEQARLHQEGVEHYEAFKTAFAGCLKAHEAMKDVSSKLGTLGREYHSINARTGNKFKHLKFTLITPFDRNDGAQSGTGVRFFDEFKAFVERQATFVADGKVVLSETQSE